MCALCFKLDIYLLFVNCTLLRIVRQVIQDLLEQCDINYITVYQFL
jgi:hypothetical protein